MFRLAIRQALPKATDRLPLGTSGLRVSPLCLGIAGSPETVAAAYDAGINFFFLTADLHWPLYEGLRRGLEMLLARSPAVRDDIVVGVVSYLEQPLFGYLQFHEVLDSVRGLGRVDLAIIGAVADRRSLVTRLEAIQRAKAAGHPSGGRAAGGSFHDRPTALLSINHNALDINYIRYNTAHTGAREDIFPHLRPDRTGLIYNFKSTLSRVTAERLKGLGLNGVGWLPTITDYYRFVLTSPHIDGLLCSLSHPGEVDEMVTALKQPPLTPQEESYMAALSSAVTPKYF